MAKTQKSSKKTFIIVAVMVLALILIDFSPAGGNIRFYAKWIECGGRPVQTASWKGIAWYEPAPVFALVRSKQWFCTPLQAEQAGYSANSQAYEFPHLTEDEAKALFEPK